MTFGGSPHSAEKVQHDVNSILDAIALLIARVKVQQLEAQATQLDPLQMKAELIDDPIFVGHAELLDEPGLLKGDDPKLLRAGPPEQIVGVPVRLQIGEAVIAGTLAGDLPEQLLQLPPEQIAYLREVVETAATSGEVEVIEGELVDIEVDGQPCFRHEPPRQLPPHQERLIGQEDEALGESADKTAVVLSPEVQSVAETVQQFFALTGLQEFEGQHYRLKMVGNQLSVEAKDGRGQVLAVDGEKGISRLDAQDFRQFETAREMLIDLLCTSQTSFLEHIIIT
jgi:hypothetical protein